MSLPRTPRATSRASGCATGDSAAARSRGLPGTGKDLKVSVRFDDEEHGVKQLLVAYAGLEREWESA